MDGHMTQNRQHMVAHSPAAAGRCRRVRAQWLGGPSQEMAQPPEQMASALSLPADITVGWAVCFGLGDGLR